MENSKSTDEDDHFFDASDDFPFFDCPSSPSPSPSPSSPKSTLYSSPDIEIVDSENVETENIVSSNETQFHLLIVMVEFLIKAIGFQFNLIINFVTLPFTLFYYLCLIFVNPIYIVRVCRDCLINEVRKMWSVVGDWCHPFVFWVNENRSVLKLVVRYGLGLLWSIYVSVILVSLLVSSFLFGGLIMRYYVVQQPFELKQGLNFDFTRTRPLALVPISVCNVGHCDEKNGFECVGGGGGGDGGVRVITPYHKLQAAVTLILPESYYNRNLGIFQIRMDFLSETGKSLVSLSRISMLEFKSEPIRLLLTFFKVIPLVSGYMSETQTLRLKFSGYNEGVIPTACIKVTIEQRAEFRPGAGIPEIYDAYLHLESELPFLKRCVWQWRRTIFVWLSMMLFVVELLFGLVCCRPLLLPRTRSRANTTRSSSPQTSSQVQNQTP